MSPLLTQDDTTHLMEVRDGWLDWLRQVDFNDGSDALEEKLTEHVRQFRNGLELHLAGCSVIPEEFSHDSSEEKLYSKYTDVLLAFVFQRLGVDAVVLAARADSADVAGTAPEFSFVADAKAFRLSRTAKNQKDFKVQAMATWKDGSDHAVVVAPLYQVPSRTSQIYRQATEQHVAICSYAHLVILLQIEENKTGTGLLALQRLLETPGNIRAEKSASDYWQAIHHAVTEGAPEREKLWANVMDIFCRCLDLLKVRELQQLDVEIQAIRELGHDEAVELLIEAKKIPQRRKTIEAIGPTDVFDY